MATQDEIDAVEAAIIENATGPHSVTVGGHTVVSKTAKDLIEAHQHISVETAADLNHFGLRFTKLVPPGCG